MSTLALFGGSFNPPHIGHVLAVTYVLATQPVDGALVVPVFEHAFGKELAPFADRMALAEAAMAWLPRVEVSDVEKRFGGESRTLFTLRELQRQRPGDSFRLVIGSDVLPDLPKWHRWDLIESMAPPIVLGRAGHEHPGAPPAMLPEVSSTALRAHARSGTLAEVAHLVPTRVREAIEARGLYR